VVYGWLRSARRGKFGQIFVRAKKRLSGLGEGRKFAQKSKFFRAQRSDAHGHYDVAVAAGIVAEGAELAGGLFVF
jgi:hypothetical protein